MVATSIIALNIVMNFTRDNDSDVDNEEFLVYTAHIYRTALDYSICVFVSVVT
jgi:hypothetical protein